MIKSSCPHFILWALASLLLVLFVTFINCQKNFDEHYPLEETFWEKRSLPIQQYVDLTDADQWNEEDIDGFRRQSSKFNALQRRSPFHALRGKRRVI